MLHLGENVVIPHSKVVAILDIESLGDSEANLEFLQTAKEEGFVRNITKKAKSLVITTENIMYLSPISSVTLKSRFEKPYAEI